MSLNILFTGASTGFGNAIAKSLAYEGHSVIVTADGELGGIDNIEVFSIDIFNPDSVDMGMRRILGKYGGIDVLIDQGGCVGVLRAALASMRREGCGLVIYAGEPGSDELAACIAEVINMKRGKRPGQLL